MGTFARIWQYLTISEKWILCVGLLLRSSLAALDLLGVAIIGLTVSMLANGANSTSLPPAINTLLAILSSWGLVNTYAVLASLGVILFAGKSAISLWFTHLLAVYMARLEARKSSALFSRIVAGDLDQISSTPPSRVSFTLTSSTSSAFNQGLTALSSLVVELTMFTTISVFMFVSSPVGFTIMAIFFGAVGASLFFGVGRATSKIAKVGLDNTLVSGELVHDTLMNFRQVATSKNRQEFVDKFEISRSNSARAYGKLGTLTAVTRHAVEVALMFGLGLLLLQRSTNFGVELSASTIAILTVGGFRIMTSLIPLQGIWNTLRQIKTDAGLALEFYDRYFGSRYYEQSQNSRLAEVNSNFELRVEGISYKYPLTQKFVIKNARFTVPERAFVAVVGKSGAGKSTLADLVLGLRTPTTGKIHIGDHTAVEIRKSESGLVSYVPQRTTLIPGSIRLNVSLSYEVSEENDSRVVEALRLANALEFVESLPLGIDTILTGDGAGLSGGQTQRIGLARGIYPNPKVLVLDEATSALDGQTEREVGANLQRLSEKMSLFVIAHRFETVKSANLILHVNEGKVTASSNWSKIDLASMHLSAEN